MRSAFLGFNLTLHINIGVLIGEIMKISEAFSKLLEDLASGGVLTESAKDALCSEVQKKLQESEGSDLETLEVKFKEALNSTAEELSQKFAEELAAVKSGSDQEEQQEEAEADVTISDAFKQFLSAIPKENVEAFNALADTLNDEQKSKFDAFLAGQFGKLEVEPASEAEKEVPEVEESEADEAIGVLDKLCGGICESEDVPNDLVDLAKKLLSEAPSSRIAALNRKYEKEYERLLKRKIKEMGAENRSGKLTGGVVGKAKRINDLGRILKNVRQELYLRESELEELNSQLVEAKASRRMAEAEKRDLKERISQIGADNGKLSEALENLKKENLRLDESVKDVQNQLQLNEAKAFLVEKTATLAPRMKAHLIKEFSGKNLEFVKSNLNEAIDAFNEQERRLAESLRNRSSVKPSQIVSKDAEKEEVEEKDPLVISLVESLKLGR